MNGKLAQILVRTPRYCDDEAQGIMVVAYFCGSNNSISNLCNAAWFSTRNLQPAVYFISDEYDDGGLPSS